MPQAGNWIFNNESRDLTSSKRSTLGLTQEPYLSNIMCDLFREGLMV